MHGEILIDGKPIREATLASLRRNIGVVFQNPFLYHCTVFENILLARPEASMEEVRSAAKAAHAHEFITALPLGYETVVGEREAAFPEARVQRIALARVFLKNPR